MSSQHATFQPGESFAKALDLGDPLARFRDRFLIPHRPDGRPVIYLCGNSLGLQPTTAAEIVNQELRDWGELAVDAHFRGKRPWYPYHVQLRDAGARLVGARPHEVVFMNGLTVNLHLLMASFYRPTPQRFKILIENCAFPSDIYAARTQLRLHGFDPATALLTASPRPGEYTLHTEDIETLLQREGRHIALVLLGGVNYFTGQFLDLPRITAAAQAQGCIVAFDLAHAAGNVPLQLHDWNIDFAAWCTYKYLNSGPGALAGCFIHERHVQDRALPRLGGWWGNDPATRFRMHLNETFEPVPSADAWQLSNPPILSAAPLVASLAIFDEAGMPALREKSLRLTGYLQFLLDQIPSERYTVITPRDAERRGCQLSILAHHRPKELFRSLEADGVVCDFREPNVVRVAPVPLYNTYHEVWRFAEILRRHV
ncbi:Kynureninase [Phycisphaerae bacterium RAS1]|nr:Kynureninase [Phycisphaerae bacterium RAS1]